MKKNYFQNNSKKYNKKVFILLFVLINFTSFAQQIKGKVTDNKGETLIGATATIKGSTKGTTTNVNGEFLFENISNGNYTLIVSSIGYTTKEVTVKVPQSRELKILLEESTATLEEVVVTGVGAATSKK